MGCLTAKASGSVANFISPTVTPIESAKVYFSPTQLGEGTPSPENVREIVGRTSVELYQCGKNLIDINTATKGRRINIQGEEVLAADYYFSDYVPVLPLTQYYLFNAGEMAANACTGFYDSDKQFVGTTSKINPITTTANCFYIRCSFRKENLQIVQLHRYDDIKTIPFSWKRLPDEYQEVEYIESNENGEYIDTGFIGNMGVCVETKFNLLSVNGNPAIIGSRIGSNRFSFPVYYKGFDLAIVGDASIGTWNLQETYTASIVTNNNGSRMDIYGDNDYHVYKTVSSKVNNNLPLYIFRYNRNGNPDTINSSALRLYYLKIYDGGISNNLMVRYFIPCYRKSDNEIGMYDTISQTFYTNQGTGTFLKGNDVFSDEVYGGYVDLVNGEIVDEWGIADLGQLSWSYDSLYQRFQSSSIGSLVKRGSSARKVDMYCSGFLCLSDGRSIGNVSDLSIYEGGNGAIYVHDSTYTNKNDFVLAVDGIILVYPLKTQITHPLPDYLKTQLQTLKNENTFWSDADSVEIDYGLAETFDIQKAKRKIIMNQPHVETASNSPSSPQVIKFKTDMKAPLKECIINFAPIQEGSGDPSPDNIRPIKGWNGITLNHTGINMLNCSSPSYYYDATNNGITSKSTKNENGIVESISFNGTTTGTNIFRNLNFIPAIPNNITIPSGRIALTTYSSQVYIVPMGQGNIPRTVNGKAWDQAHMDAVDNWTEWNVNSYDTYEGLWIRAQILPRQTDLNINTTIYPMMCLAEDKGCEFEPYKGETFDIDWTNEIGTVYGGYVDLVSGQLVITYYSPSATSWTIVKQNNGFICYKTETPDIVSGTWYCNMINEYGNFNSSNMNKNIIQRTKVGTDIYLALDENADILNLQLVMPLATPTVYQLTPQQILSLKGQNNLWAYTNGTIDVKYWKH